MPDVSKFTALAVERLLQAFFLTLTMLQAGGVREFYVPRAYRDQPFENLAHLVSEQSSFGENVIAYTVAELGHFVADFALNSVGYFGTSSGLENESRLMVKLFYHLTRYLKEAMAI